MFKQLIGYILNIARWLNRLSNEYLGVRFVRFARTNVVDASQSVYSESELAFLYPLSELSNIGIASKTVLFWETNGLNKWHSVPMVLGVALQTRGHLCYGILCDAIVPECDETSLSTLRSTSLCFSCKLRCSKSFQSVGIPVGYLRSFLTKEAINQAYQLPVNELLNAAPLNLKTDILQLSKNTVVRYYRGLPYDDDVGFLRDRVIRSGLLAYYAAERVLQVFDPDVVVVQNGKLMMEAIPKILFRRAGKRVVVWEGGLHRRSVAMSADAEGGNDYAYPIAWRNLAQDPPTAKEEADVDEFIAKRRVGIGIYELGRQPVSVQSNVISIIGVSKFNRSYPVVTFFGNISWDSSMFDSHILFDSMFDWLIASLRYLKGKSVNVIVRPHPGEQYSDFGTQIQTTDVIKEAGLELENVFIIDRDCPVNSYDLIDVSTAVVVYGSNIGIEAACLGKSVISCANRHFRGKGFTLDPETQTEYWNYLDSIVCGHVPDMSVAKINLAKKYAQMLFLLASHDLGHIIDKDGGWTQDDLKQGQDPVVDFLCNGIVDNGDFVAASPLMEFK